MTTITIPTTEFCASMHPWQRAMFDAFDDGCRRFWMRWHRRARKTTAWLNMLIRECVCYDNRVYLYLAPTYKQAKSIFWTDPNMLFKWLPNQSLIPWVKNEQELSIRFANNSILRVVGGDDPDSVRGIDCHGFVADEWSLMKPVLWDQILRPIIAQDADRWAAFAFCVAPDTLVLTRKGWMKIRDVQPNAEVGYTDFRKELYGLGGFHPAESFYRSERCPTLKIKTVRGYEIECTHNHRLWGPDGWVFAQDVAEGAPLCIQHSQRIWGNQIGWGGFVPSSTHGATKPLRFTPNADFYYFLGLFIGDGSCTRNNVTITTADQEIREFLNRYGFVQYDQYHMTTSSMTLVDLLEYFKCTKKKAHEKIIPPQILAAPQWAQAAFFSGLFDADGCAGKRNVVSFSSTSESLVRCTQTMLLNFGIISSRTQNRKPGVSKRAKGRYRSWNLEIRSRFAVQFYDNIGFRLTRKQSRRPTGRVDGENVTLDYACLPDDYFAGLNEGDTKRQAKLGIMSYATVDRLNQTKPDPYLQALVDSDMVEDRVASVCESESEVMDFVIPETHSFVSNGLVSHNTPAGQNHAYEGDMHAQEDRFGQGGQWFYSLLTADESGLIPHLELEKAKQEMPPSLYDQEFNCSFITEEERSVITSRMLDNLRASTRILVEPSPRKLISCDPSMGGDRCPIMSFVGTKVRDIEIINDRDEMRSVGRILIAANKLGTKEVVIDSSNMGSAWACRLQEMGLQVIRFNSSEASSDDKYANRKAEAWFVVADLIRQAKVAFPEDVQLRRELSAPKYDIRNNGRLCMELKEITKKELGCSPDLADTWVMGQWAMEKTPRQGQRILIPKQNPALRYV